VLDIRDTVALTPNDVFGTLALAYLRVTSTRLIAALPYLREVGELGHASPWLARIQVAYGLFNVARKQIDTS
jgi:hypothetical protein